MHLHPHVRELIRFEEQALGTSIVWSDDDQPITSAVVVRPAPTCESDDARPRLVEDESPQVHRDGAVVQLGFDLNVLAGGEDRTGLSQIWDSAISPALAEAARHLRESLDREQLGAFVALEERVWRESAARLPGLIDNAEYAAGRAEDQLRENVRRLVDLRRQHRALRTISQDAIQESARQQHEALRRLVPRTYRKVALRADHLIGEIDTVVIEHDGREIELGRFEVTVDVASSEVAIRNLTNAVDGMQHPHVRAPSDICWGNIRPGIVRLITEREWAGLLVVIHRFLHSYTPNDAYVKLEAFDPDQRDDEDEEEDEDDADESDDSSCGLCGEALSPGDETVVQHELLCRDCVERDTFTCGGCGHLFTTREQARASIHCTTCWNRRAQAAS